MKSFPIIAYHKAKATMKMQNRNQIVARLFLLCALVLSAFSHRAGPVPNSLDSFDMRAYVAQYMLPDGTLPILCLNGAPNQPQRSVACDFCLIAGGVMLADLLDVASFHTHASQAVFLDQNAEWSGRELYRLYAALRAPPVTFA